MATAGIPSYSIIQLVATIFTVITIGTQGVCGVRVYMAESDVRTSEDSLQAQVTILVAELAHNTTLVVIPLTVTQYLNERSLFGKVCDSLLLGNTTDQAEESDFSGLPQEMGMSPQSSPNSHIFELTVDIPLHDDNVQEPAEYFLAVLATRQPGDNKYTIDTNSGRQCSRIDIDEDRDDFGVTFEPMVTTINEDAGEIEAFKVVKKGLTEKTVTISLFLLVSPANYRNPIMSIIPRDIILKSNDTEVTVKVTITDDKVPEKDTYVLIYGQADTRMYGQYSNLPLYVEFTVLDNDHAVIGFEQTEVTVIEGEDAFLTTFFRSNDTSVDYHGGFFTVFSQVGKGNATALKHYIDISESAYHPGDPIKISTIDDSNLEKSRWFEVRLTDPNSNPLYLLEPNVARVIILDNDGTPSQPSIGKVTFSPRDVTVSWTIPKEDLRPVQGYTITVETSTSTSEDKNVSSPNTKSPATKRQATDGNNHVEEYHFNVTTADCKFDPSTENELCEITLQLEAKQGVTYSITLCATNAFGVTCGTFQQAVNTLLASDTAPNLSSKEETSLPLGAIVGIVIGMLLPAILCCVVFICCTVISKSNKQKEQVIDDEIDDDVESYIGGSTQESIKLSRYVAMQ